MRKILFMASAVLLTASSALAITPDDMLGMAVGHMLQGGKHQYNTLTDPYTGTLIKKDGKYYVCP